MERPLEKCADKFIETSIDDETVIMDLDSGSFFALSGSALAIWTAIDGNRGRAAVLAAVCEEYGAPAGDLAGDVDAFLGELAGAGLVREG